jgi:6-phosphogluconolactonase
MNCFSHSNFRQAVMLERRAFSIGLGLAMLAGPALAREPVGDFVYVGTHGDAGVYGARFDPKTGRLAPLGQVAAIDRATALVSHPTRPILYSVSELGNDGAQDGKVFALAIDPRSGRLATIGSVTAGGGGSTHLAIDTKLGALFVANYGGGSVAAIPLAADGTPQPVSAVQVHAGSGPSPRQKSPHAHGVTVDPGRRFILSPDLGADKIYVHRYDPATKALAPADPPFEATPAGSGPRHLVFLPNGRLAILATELTAELRTFRWDAKAGRLTPLQALSADVPGYAGPKSVAELRPSADSRFLYISNRGDDTLVVYTVDADSGRLTEIQRLPCGGKTPWSFGVHPSGRWMIVANEASSQLSVFKIDPASGKLTATGETLPVPKPVAIAFYPARRR